ncbi:Protein ENHANCED DOWNY MILDEW 2 [Heracleum sosnowskyi]|uniref:Protein ENHANCED DOWNY MILDEW 2 n=1 Tax=Heracleum sosnowskyi TaxID=360622 RepID=A0AAD8GMU4_9APIA|nr:Protein ENHANCED DOWNY MILDEW 2 [Heracleum sosnowskyi]
METYEEEEEILPDCVINYYTVDGNNQPVPFSVLPLVWSGDETPGNSDTQIFLCGSAVTGQKMYKKIIGWRPEISYVLPMIYVLSENKLWIDLRRPGRSFEDDYMSTLITVHCLHFLKWNLKADGSALWNHLQKAFSTYDIPHLKRHLSSHLPLIQEAVKRDKDLAKSELLPTFLLETRTCEVNRATKKITFEADSQEGYKDTDGDVDDDEAFDSVCVLCDDGGELIRCEDKCLRSFHPNIKAGFFCESLGYSDAQVEAMLTFICNNCQYQQHQCFVCGKLGSSDQSSAPEVFQCANGDCGHFYHPNCIAELLQPCDTLETKELQLKIHSGETFVCPAHKCCVCMKGEDKAVHELQFAMCRRCPKAYHRKCLPREISFTGDWKNDERAWDDLLPGRILIYCMDHEILSDIRTPKRDHIIFPNVEGKKQTNSGLLSSKEKLIKSRVMANFALRSPLKQRSNHSGIYRGHSTSATFTGEKIFGHANIGKSKLSTPQSPTYVPSSSKGKISDYLKQSADKFMKVKGSSSRPAFDSELKSRMLKLVEDSMSSFNMEESLEGKKSSSLYASNVRITEDKTFTEGKVKGCLKAVQTAMKILNLNDGGKLEDAKAVCEPQKQLNTYLGPFLLGKRCTSFGRHFTKVSKLELIVDKLRWYVQDGDTIVDFCCGANDFSCLMRERLHKMGKICSFKNYDLITPKNDFNFEQKDWMTVTSEELPAGSNLIMGLNPPFGVDGILANKFIDKALTFKPKLLILIVPIETERLDRKKESPYDNIWEDHQLPSGKAFYLPGSVDVNGEQLEQHNVAPPLYLWSRPDWTAKHKTIAETCGHGAVTHDPRLMGKMVTGENHDGMYEDMEVDSAIYFPSNSAEQKHSNEWNSKGFYPSHYTMGMQHSSGVSDAAMGMQHPYVVSDAMQGVYHDLLQHPSVVSDAVEGVHQGAFPPSCQYPTEPYFYPE